MQDITKIADLQDGQECSISGKVIRTFERRGVFVSTILDDSGMLDVSTPDQLLLDSILTASGRVTKRKASIEMRVKDIAQVKDTGDISKRIDAFIESKSIPLESPPLIQDAIMNSIHPSILECAKRILLAHFLLRPIVLRYHCDADGICAALSIARPIRKGAGRFISFQNGGATYQLQDTLRDINMLRSFGESTGIPLFILVDMGSGPENTDSLDILRGAGVETVLIDHHPLSPDVSEMVDCIVSPATVSASSSYTAGLLSGEVSKSMGAENISILQKISLAGDKSDLMTHERESIRKALVLDYLGKYSKFPNTLEFYSGILSDEPMLNSLYMQASSKLENALRVAKESLKVKELSNGFRLCITNLQKAVRPRAFPGKGLICGVLHDYMASEMSGPLVTIGYSGKLISLRANTEARERGFDANAIISDIKRELINSIESGGGHDIAASVHVNEGFENIVLEEIIRHIYSLP
ncbi:MAG: DHH family phosphoesterase [Candidatus Micrarchaeota archaeon]